MPLPEPIYMDYSATTPVDPRVLEAMLPYFKERFGNAASRHHAKGWEAEESVEIAREHVARAIGGDPREIVFTSGATESNNLALQGVAGLFDPAHCAVVTTPIEHKSVLDVAEALAQRGHRVSYLPVDPDGVVRTGEMEKLLDDSTRLVSVMLANNETGVIQPVAEVGRICRARGIPLHVDATQALGRIPVDVGSVGADLLSLSGHKIYGPKGVGALYVRRKRPGVRLRPLIAGGGHEGGLRSGTLNVPGIVGMGEACRLAAAEMAGEAPRLTAMRDRLEGALLERLQGVRANGAGASRLPNLTNLSFQGLTGESLLGGLRRVAASTGSACTSGSLEPSYVLRAMGLPDDLARSSLRLSLGRFTTDEEIDLAVDEIAEVVARLKKARSRVPPFARTGESVD